MASLRNHVRVSMDASTRELGALFTVSSTFLEKPTKSAYFQFQRSSVIGGGCRVMIWQFTDITIVRWSDPIQSVVDHSTLSSQLLYTSATSIILPNQRWSGWLSRRSRHRNHSRITTPLV